MMATSKYEQMSDEQQLEVLRQFMYVEKDGTVDDSTKTSDQLLPVFMILAYIDREAAISIMTLTDGCEQSIGQTINESVREALMCS